MAIDSFSPAEPVRRGILFAIIPRSQTNNFSKSSFDIAIIPNLIYMFAVLQANICSPDVLAKSIWPDLFPSS
jgi:hypothetical protein